MESKTKEEIAVSSTEQAENRSPKPKGEAKTEDDIAILKVEGRKRSTSYIDPAEAYDFWKVYKEGYVTLQSWEDEQRAKTTAAKNLVTFFCDALILSMSRANASNQSLMNYFVTVGAHVRNFAKVCAKSCSSIDPIIAYHNFTGKGLAELFSRLKGASGEFTNNLQELGSLADQTANEVKSMAIVYARKLSELKEYKPKLLKVCEVAKSRGWRRQRRDWKSVLTSIRRPLAGRKPMCLGPITRTWTYGSPNAKSLSQYSSLIA